MAKQAKLLIEFLLVALLVSVAPPNFVFAQTNISAPAPKIDYFNIAKRVDAYGMSSPFTANGQFLEIVAPDVLYSWMSQAKLDLLLATSDSKALLPAIGRPHYLWRTPVGSFGYGAVSIRIKLKEGVKFALIPHLHQSNSDYEEKFEILKNTFDIDNTVFVSEIPIAGYHEYYVFTGGPIHSLSTGTPEHFDEISKETDWISRHDRYENFDLIFKISPAEKLGNTDQVANLTEPVTFDHLVWSREELAKRVDQIGAQIASHPHGIIIFSEGVSPNRADHFASKLKPYWE